MEKMLKSLAKFQSTLPRGERRCSHVPFGSVFIISIHAPARGATASSTFISSNRILFQSTLPRGSDRSSQPIAVVYFPFSIHAPARERLHHISIQYLAHNFNPRSREGERPMYPPFLRIDGNFNPRSREGATGL